jgi:hypothetical protein
VDFKRNKDGIPAKVNAIEYDPNRSANLALLFYADGEKRYILAPQGLNVGGGNQARKLFAAGRNPGGQRNPQYRNEAGRRRQAGSFGR